MKFKRIVCVLCGSSEADRDHRPIIHYTIDDKAHCDYCIANMIRDTKTNNKKNITGLSGQELDELPQEIIKEYKEWFTGSIY